MRFALMFWFVIFTVVLSSALAQSPVSTTSAATTGATASSSGTTPVQDPQAVSILNQVLAAAGGAQVIRAVSDYKAEGSITYPRENSQGSVTIQGLAGRDYRMDATLPSGVRSISVSQGAITTKSAVGKVSTNLQPTAIPSSDVVQYVTPLFAASTIFPVRPLQTITTATNAYGLAQAGTKTVDGHSVYGLQVQRLVLDPKTGKASPLPFHSRDIFVDVNSSQIVMVSDTLAKTLTRELHYSDYRNISGVLMPFSITEVLGGQETWSIQLSQITFDLGLDPSVFTIQ